MVCGVTEGGVLFLHNKPSRDWRGCEASPRSGPAERASPGKPVTRDLLQVLQAVLPRSMLQRRKLEDVTLQVLVFYNVL